LVFKTSYIEHNGEKYIHSNQPHHSINLSIRSHISTMYISRNSLIHIDDIYTQFLTPRRKYAQAQLVESHFSDILQLTCLKYNKIHDEPQF